MYIKLYKGFLNPTNLHRTKEEIEKNRYNTIEFKLTQLGFKIHGSNYAIFECVNISDLSRMFVQLRKLGFSGAEVCWS